MPKCDFIPSLARARAYFTTEHLVGAVAARDFNGLQVLGSYGDAWLIESHYVPTGYVIVAATGGLDSDLNPVGFRRARQPGLSGLRHIPGAGPYPIVTASYGAGLVSASDTEAQPSSCR